MPSEAQQRQAIRGKGYSLQCGASQCTARQRNPRQGFSQQLGHAKLSKPKLGAARLRKAWRGKDFEATQTMDFRQNE